MDKYKNGDYILSFAAVIQPFLVILQQCLISVLNIPIESSTKYRVVMSAIPIIFAFVYIIKRNFKLTLYVYAIVLSVLSINLLLFPENETFLLSLSFRFLLPIVIPITLSVISIKKWDIFMKCMYSISWAVFFITSFYAYFYFMDFFIIDNYNMGFSYSLLLPSIILYNHKKWYSITASFLMFIVIIAVGSRGPAIVFSLCILYDFFVNNRKYLLILILSLSFLFSISNYLFLEIEKIGIKSRTLFLLLEGKISSDSGRKDIYNVIINKIYESPLIGSGLYADRTILGGTSGAYSHNLFLEVYLNFGIIIGSILLLYLFLKTIITYIKIGYNERILLVLFFILSVIPLMFSGSYLTDYTLALFIGILFKIGHEN